ncbi:MAG: hypothetical protein JW957_08060 [Candidatus Omnitrophica bacterium]|nr:hypothetical protein [Candidatus Omnitrophota bacterium]
MVARKIILTAGYAILVTLTLLLFLATLAVKINHGAYSLALLQIIILTGLIYECGREGFNTLNGNKLIENAFGIDDFYNFTAVALGALITYILSVRMELGPVVAAGLTGMAAALVKPKYGVPAYCGAFVGMTCPKYLCNYSHILFAGAASGIIFIISKPFFKGFGGKLGTIAFAGCLFTGAVVKSPLQSFSVPGWDTGLLILAYAAAGAVFTYLLNITLGYGPVLASGVTSLAGGILLPAIHGVTGNTLAVVIICSSFAGMSDKSRFRHTQLMVIAGLFAGIVFMFSMPHMGGAGGKLGTIAFGSVIALRGILNILGIIKLRFRKTIP